MKPNPATGHDKEASRWTNNHSSHQNITSACSLIQRAVASFGTECTTDGRLWAAAHTSPPVTPPIRRSSVQPEGVRRHHLNPLRCRSCRPFTAAWSLFSWPAEAARGVTGRPFSVTAVTGSAASGAAHQVTGRRRLLDRGRGRGGGARLTAPRPGAAAHICRPPVRRAVTPPDMGERLRRGCDLSRTSCLALELERDIPVYSPSRQ